MPLSLQQKILRTIEYQTFERVGGGEPIQVDVRVTAATNADLQQAMENGEFRRDLYDRLAFDVIELLPLRDRRQDIPALCQHFIDRFREEVASIGCRGVSPKALEALGKLPLLGNVRELKNLVERAAYRCANELIEVSDLDLIRPVCAPDQGQARGFHDKVRAFERSLLEASLSEHANLIDAAKALELGYDQLRRLVRKHGLRNKA